MKYLSVIIAAASFYIVPAIIGAGFSALFKGKKQKQELIENVMNGLVNFATGGLLLYIQIVLINKLFPLQNLDTSKFFAALVISNIVISLTIYLSKNLKDRKRKISRIDIKDVLITALLLVIATLTYGLWKMDSPTFATLNWDLYHHQALINLIKTGKFTVITSNLSDSFQFATYSTIFHTLMAIPQAIFKVNILEYWWFAEYYHLITVALVSFGFTYAITKKKLPALIGGILGVMVFESSMAYTSLFLIPQNLSAVVAGAFLAQLIKNYPQNRKELIFNSIIFVLFVLSTHLVIGSLAIFLYFFAFAFLYFRKIEKTKKIKYILLLLSFLLIPTVYFISTRFNFDSVNRGEAVEFNYSLKEKFDLMRDFYGYGLIAFLPLGYFYAIKKGKKEYILALILNNGIIALIVSPLPYILKLCGLGRLPLHTIMALGIWFLIKPLSLALKAICLVLLEITLFTVFIANVSKYKVVPSYKNFSTHVSLNEIQATNFLREEYGNYGKNHDEKVLLVSDPATMHILEGLSGVNSPGGAYTSLKTREILTSIYLTRDENIGRKLFEIEDSVVEKNPDKILLVIGGRFRKWQLAPNEDRYGIYWNVWHPYDLEPKELEKYDFIHYLGEFAGFKEVFRNEGMVIFEVENDYRTF